MYETLLIVHSYLRWVVLFLMLVVIVKSLLGLINKSSYQRVDKSLAISMGESLRVQFVIGIVLYIFLSPITQTAFSNFGAAMKDPTLRYYAVEHILVMLIGVALVEIGRAKAKKATEDLKKFKLQLIFFSISLLIMLSRIPFDGERLFR